MTQEEEITGLDITEHGLPSAYSGFAITDMSGTMAVNANTDLGADSYDTASEKQRARININGRHYHFVHYLLLCREPLNMLE